MSEKKENIIAILKTLDSKKISQEIWTSKLDIVGLEQVFKNEKIFKITANPILKLSALFFHKDLDLKIFFTEICATNLEKKYFKFLLDHCSLALDLSTLKQLLAFEEKDLVLYFYLFFLARKSDSIKHVTAKKNLQFLQKFILPKFPLKGEDVMRLGFKGSEIGIAMATAKKLWAKNNFTSDVKFLLQLLKTGSKDNR